MFTSIAAAMTAGIIALAPGFCAGERSVGQYDGSYKTYLAEHALDAASQITVEETAYADALSEGQTKESAQEYSARKKAEAKAAAAQEQAKYIRLGQIHLCGKESDNW